MELSLIFATLAPIASVGTVERYRTFEAFGWRVPWVPSDGSLVDPHALLTPTCRASRETADD